MIRAILVDTKTNKALHSEVLYGDGFEPLEGEITALVTVNPLQAHGVFKAVSRVDEGTTTIITPDPSGSILLTDIMISATKVNASTAELLFDDDTNSETLFKADMTNGEMFFSHTFAGRMQGWRNARFDLTTVNGSDVYVTVGYVKLEKSLVYSEWNSLR